MEIKEIYSKINNLLDVQESRDLSENEERELKNLKKLRNKLDPDSYELVKLCL